MSESDLKTCEKPPYERSNLSLVAQLSGCSVSLVSKVYSGRMGTSSVRPGLRERIQEAARSVNFVPSSSARSFTKGLTVLFLALPLLSVSAEVRNPEREQNQRGGKISAYEKREAIRYELNRYRLEAGEFLSANGRKVLFLLYRPKSPLPVPLVIYLAGSGERGDDLGKQFRQRTVFEKVCSESFQKRHPCYLLALSPPEDVPTLLGGLPGKPSANQQLMMDAVQAVLSSCSRPKIDRSRIYGTGLSFGGNGIYALSGQFPDFFAAVLPVAAMPPSSIFPEKSPLPSVWHLYNEEDYKKNGIRPARLQQIRTRFLAESRDFRIGTFPDTGHNAWDKTWRDDGIWDWMFSKKRGGGSVLPLRRVRPSPSAARGFSASVCSASRNAKDEGHGPERITDGLRATYYLSAEPVSRGDWVQIEFPEEVSGMISILSGTGTGEELLLRRGRVEVSANGLYWERGGNFSARTGICSFRQRTPIRFLKILPEPAKPQLLALRELSVCEP